MHSKRALVDMSELSESHFITRSVFYFMLIDRCPTQGGKRKRKNKEREGKIPKDFKRFTI